jgi:hypothetical protein
MEIKGPGRPNPPITPPSDSRVEERRGAQFPGAAKTEAEKAVGAMSHAGPAQVRTQFRRADLSDSAKVDKMVHLSAEELVKSQPGAAKLGTPAQQQIVDWIEHDPAMRGKILSHLERILE